MYIKQSPLCANQTFQNSNFHTLASLIEFNSFHFLFLSCICFFCPLHNRQDVKPHMGYAKMGLYKTKSKRSIANYHHIIIINIFILSSITSSSMASSSSPSSIDFSTAILIRVDQSGKGDFSKIQEAIESIPPNLNNSQLYFIWVKPGIYRYI